MKIDYCKNQSVNWADRKNQSMSGNGLCKMTNLRLFERVTQGKDRW